ncbi:MAG: hypothetical protein GON13_00475 [Nanoarchaeota archaeon]|nr:hypothetical protein [Nanoarchaeota archaeon]
MNNDLRDILEKIVNIIEQERKGQDITPNEAKKIVPRLYLLCEEIREKYPEWMGGDKGRCNAIKDIIESYNSKHSKFNVKRGREYARHLYHIAKNALKPVSKKTKNRKEILQEIKTKIELINPKNKKENYEEIKKLLQELTKNNANKKWFDKLDGKDRNLLYSYYIHLAK